MRIKQWLFLGSLGVALMGVGLVATPVTVAFAKANRTLRTFPKSIRGTWYTYNNHHYYRVKITAKQMISAGTTQRLHSRKNVYFTGKPWAKRVHPSWIIAAHAYYQDEDWIWTYGWYQGAGAGNYYMRTSNYLEGKYHPALQLASGAGIWTDGYAYHTKHLARHYSNAHFEGDRYRPNN